jgi:tetratricopeptide (TPR) repeat protein
MMMDKIYEILEKAEKKFPSVFDMNKDPCEEDYYFEEFICEEIEKLGGVAVWYCSVPHCNCAIAFPKLNKYYNIDDYIKKEISEIDKNEFLECAREVGMIEYLKEEFPELFS